MSTVHGSARDALLRGGPGVRMRHSTGTGGPAQHTQKRFGRVAVTDDHPGAGQASPRAQHSAWSSCFRQAYTPACPYHLSMPTRPTRTFHLGDILGVLANSFLSPTGWDGIRDILDYLSGQELAPHQLSRAANAARTGLLQQFPHLDGARPGSYSP